MKLSPNRLLPTSLGGRLVLGMALFTLVALVVTWIAMDRVLDRFVTGQIDQRLDNKLVSLASQVRVDADGRLRLEGDADGPPFDERRHMSFWRVEGPRNALQSRWLTPGELVAPNSAEIAAAPLPPHPPPPREELRSIPHPRTLRRPGPDGHPTHMRLITKQVGDTPVTILAAAPLRAIQDPKREAMTALASAIVVVCLVMMFAGFLLVRIALQPLSRVRREIADVRTGRRAALTDGQPIEIRPLVDELNDLLAQNAANLARARKHVANLAHGLKTPLATLSLGVARLGVAEKASLAPLVDSIDRRVRHHLGRARASAALDGAVRLQTSLRPHLFDIVDALQKIYVEKRVVFAPNLPIDLAVGCEPQDVDEILGNLLENAFKYTRTRVDFFAHVEGTKVVVEIVDDGPGLRADDVERVLRPGQRLDEQVPGFGFGLPIARELVELYAGELQLEPRDKGLCVRFTLPAVPERSWFA